MEYKIISPTHFFQREIFSFFLLNNISFQIGNDIINHYRLVLEIIKNITIYRRLYLYNNKNNSNQINKPMTANILQRNC